MPSLPMGTLPVQHSPVWTSIYAHTLSHPWKDYSNLKLLTLAQCLAPVFCLGAQHA